MERILLGHGSGGSLMHELISRHLAPAFGLEGLADAAVLEAPEGRLAFSTDSYVVSPLFFPGGDIGHLAVNGTVNDLAMVGARPLYLTAGFIIEEGFPLVDLGRVVSSMAAAARRAGVSIAAGDTKVVERGKGDGIYINTAGVGVVPAGRELAPRSIIPGDRILLSGPIAAHGIAVMGERNGLSFHPPVMTDSAPLGGLVEAMLSSGEGAVRAMRDPTRGGLATTLKEFSSESRLCLVVQEESIPVASGAAGACELLWLDPLYVANEGILLAVVKGDMAEYVLNVMRQHPQGAEAALVGEVIREPAGTALLRTGIGGSRLLEMLPGEQLPRIC
jgi:hydrogenase expression/formation protein HypE